MTGRQKKPKATNLKDYRPPEFIVESVDLKFDLDPSETLVVARLTMRRGADTPADSPLRLDGGKNLDLRSVTLDGETLGANRYAVDEDSLTIPDLGDRFELVIETAIEPRGNTTLMGLYQSESMLCTQCEPEGFRNITYFPDRPDVMAPFTTTLVADRERYPVLLSNGNPTGTGEADGGRHWAKWHDPFAKPSYLFALVAGDLAFLEDRFTTAGGRPVTLRIYTEPQNVDKSRHAMDSLKQAMAWDEKEYGREYDLDVFNIVAVEDFNFGAMENKGLNIYNSKYIMANPETATDNDYRSIAAVVAHEYFHNWTGNRITCRDWFQLSLKEGLTVFRDQQFSAAMSSPAARRIEEAQQLRSAQFPEDASPMAHSVRPESYIEINNFYTSTVYEKGAEVVRMMHRLLGGEGFRRGTDLYFERHDGQAVTTEDFVRCMEDAAGADLKQFRRWYTQAGTPVLDVDYGFDEEARTFSMTVKQSCPATPGQKTKEPFHLPFEVGLLDGEGRELPLHLEGEATPGPASRVLELREPEHTFRFTNIAAAPVPSLLRGFTAPVRLETHYSDQELAFLWAHDPDPFGRWEAGQQYGCRVILRAVEEIRAGTAPEPDSRFLDSVARLLAEDDSDAELNAYALTLPDETYLGELLEIIAVDAVHDARRLYRRTIGERLAEPLARRYQTLTGTDTGKLDGEGAGLRALKNLCLDYLAAGNGEEAAEFAWNQFTKAANMTDELAAFRVLAHGETARREAALDAFYGKWRHEPLVLDSWFQVQAASPRPDALEAVRALSGHPDFNLQRPNRARALLGAFSRNQVRFHDPSGGGYRFLADHVLAIDPRNPSMSARLMGEFTRWRRFDGERRDLMRGELERIAATPDLSRGAYELASKSLE